MSKHSNRWVAGIAALATALSLTACGLQPADRPAGSAADEHLVIGYRSVPETLDPAQSQFGSNEAFIAGIYDRILRLSPDSQVAPSIAEEWAFSDDATELTLTLRSDVEFHSGNPVTAEDVVYTLDRVKALDQATATLIADYDSAQATQENEVVISLSRPNLDFTKALSAIFLLDSKLVKQNEGSDLGQQWLSNHDAGSGPYTLKSFNPNQQVELDVVDDHWLEVGNRPDELIVRIIGEPSAIRDELRAGGVDLGWGIPAVDIPSFEEDDGFNVTIQSAKRVTLGFMNSAHGPTADPRVREAMQLAFDSEGHVQSNLNGYGAVGTSILPEGIDCRVAAEPANPNLDLARQLIEEAGATGQKVTLAYQPVFAEHAGAGTLLESALTRIGLEVEVLQVTYPQLVELVKTPESAPNVSVLWDSAIYAAASQQLTTTWATGSPTNYGHYSNPKVDDLIEEGRSATDPDAACDAFEAAQDEILADRGAILMAEPKLVIIGNTRVGEIPFSPASLIGVDFALVTLAE